MMGKPVIRATRIALELIVPRIAEGASEAQLLEDYPHLTREEIRAYGAASVAHEEVLFLPDTPTKTKSNLRPPRPPRSLISQGDHRIDARRAARRYVTGERRHPLPTYPAHLPVGPRHRKMLAHNAHMHKNYLYKYAPRQLKNHINITCC